MGFMDMIKKDKKPGEAAVPPMPPGLPVDQVLAMRQQGYTNNQIIQALQRDGFSSQQVFDAMKQADLSATVGAPPQGGMENQEIPPPQGEPMGQYQYDTTAQGGMPPPMEGDMDSPMDAPMGPPGQHYGMPERDDSEKIEQIAEAIIDEKWEEFAKNINKLIEWKDSVEARIESIEEDIEKVKTDFERLHTSILGKVGEYDQNILNVGTEIKAMEKVFQKILPSLTDNVSRLSKITDDMKKKSK